MIVGVRGALTKSHRNTGRRIRERNLNRGRSVTEETSVTKIIRQLTTGFRSAQQSVFHSAGPRPINQVSLIEKVLSRRRIVVSRQRRQSLRRVNRARHVILVTTIIVPKQTPISDRQLAHLMTNQSREEIDGRPDVAVVWIAKVGLDWNIDWLPRKRWNAAIGHALIVKMLIAYGDCCAGAGNDRQGGIEAVAFQVDEPSEASRMLVHAVQTQGKLVINRLIDIAGDSPVSE